MVKIRIEDEERKKTIVNTGGLIVIILVLLAVATIAPFVISAKETNAGPKATQDLVKMISSDPRTDAKSAIDSGKNVFLAMKDKGVKVPGVPDFKEQNVRYRVVGLTNEPFNAEQQRLQRKVYAYAIAYNQTMMAHVSAESDK